MSFGFALVDAGDSTFLSGYLREDLDVFSLKLSENEGDFAVLELLVKNAGGGLLAAGAKQWLWFSHSDGATITPLFFGRVIGVPADMGDELYTLRYQARPADYETRKLAAAAALKVLPHYDPVWINADRRDDPDAVLEGRAAVWQVDRVTHAVRAVAVDAGPDGVVDVSGGHFYDSLGTSIGQPPLRRVRCEASVAWDQVARGDIDITAKVIAAFQAGGSDPSLNGYVESYTGGGLMKDWPQEGDRIGGVWEFGVCDIVRHDGWRLPADYKQVVLTNADIAKFPLWKMKPSVTIRHDISRRRTETIAFSIEADAQGVLADAGDAEEYVLPLASGDVALPIDAGGALPIGDARRRSYFLTDRGRQSLEALIELCRARMIAAARSVSVSFDVPFETGMALTTAKNVTLTDARLPGGTATGKVTALLLSADGDSGVMVAQVTIGCMTGKGGTVTPSAGTADYVDTAYVASGWQTFSGLTIMSAAGGITYSDYNSTAIADDGFDLIGLDADAAVEDVFVINGVTIQKKVLSGFDKDYGGWGGESKSRFDDLQAAVEAVEDVLTEVDLTLVPVEKGPFQTDFTVTCSALKLPKTIDLEAV